MYVPWVQVFSKLIIYCGVKALLEMENFHAIISFECTDSYRYTVTWKAKIIYIFTYKKRHANQIYSEYSFGYFEEYACFYKGYLSVKV